MVPARAPSSQCAGEILALKYPEVLVFPATEPKDETFLCFNVRVHPTIGEGKYYLNKSEQNIVSVFSLISKPTNLISLNSKITCSCNVLI